MWIKDGILYVTYQPSLIVTEEVAKICVQDRLKLCDGKAILCLRMAEQSNHLSEMPEVIYLQVMQ